MFDVKCLLFYYPQIKCKHKFFEENAHILTHNSRKHKHAYKQENAITIKVYITQDFHLLCEDELLKPLPNVLKLS